MKGKFLYLRLMPARYKYDVREFMRSLWESRGKGVEQTLLFFLESI